MLIAPLLHPDVTSLLLGRASVKHSPRACRVYPSTVHLQASSASTRWPVVNEVSASRPTGYDHEAYYGVSRSLMAGSLAHMVRIRLGRRRPRVSLAEARAVRSEKPSRCSPPQPSDATGSVMAFHLLFQTRQRTMKNSRPWKHDFTEMKDVEHTRKCWYERIAE